MTPPQPHERVRTLLWVTGGAVGNRELIQTTAQELGLSVHFCPYAELWGRAERSDVLVVELDASRDDALGLIKAARQRLPRLPIIAASTDGSVAMIRAAIEAGASDFVSLPLQTQELHKTLIKATQPVVKPAPLADVSGTIIAVYGARGGLGTTTIAVNLAVRIAALTEAHVGLVDLDLQRCDVAAFLNLTPTQSLAAMGAAAGGIDDVFLHGTLSRHPSGVFVLSAPAHIEEADTIGRETVEAALRLLRARFRHTVVDTARTLTDTTLAAFDQAERILLLTDLSVPGVRAARRILDLLLRLEIPPGRVEILITEATPNPVKVDDAVRVIGKPPFHVIPRDEAAAAQAMNAGAPLNGARDSRLGAAITQLAAKLTGAALESKGTGAPLLRRLFGRERRPTS